ncbi:37S ribosomal protein Rsm24 [Aspergillus heteromorphus CBS 117.55]|uniref:37S ribosomal protein Rsm24 n=1 Tax=Aspergillus heteromorphus CBS 117.55 TaxID=1448321 RepID=A0A317WQ08_9EURO|nr:37S ribosomal protein Rsm24 [Aspergillus heteromorphus CBS 117.55]PWY88519.1 37S ribosomal protein Rsm24 [Aspergillus heteromorphus CBS 117.55]
MASVARYLGRPAQLLVRRGQFPLTVPFRPFSVSRRTLMPKDPDFLPEPRELRPEELPPAPDYSPDDLPKEVRAQYDAMSLTEREEFDKFNRDMVAEYNNIGRRVAIFDEFDRQLNQIDRDIPLHFDDQPLSKKGNGFWAADEEDDEFAVDLDNDEHFNDDEITSMAHAELELHREIREYTRIAAWVMPSLSALAQPFTLPPSTHILRFRYTTYMGEQHPSEPKVVVELCSKDLTPTYLTEPQRQTFLKLVGTRYNPQTDIVRISCEKFGARAQNKRYLGDVIKTLIKEAKEGDAFTDIPLDVRHHKPKVTRRFPDEWVMTPERKKQLEARRAERARARDEELKPPVHGNQIVLDAIQSLPALNSSMVARATQEREKVAIKVNAKSQKKRLR